MTELPSPKQRLIEWGKILPGIWPAVERIRAAHKDGWPATVYLPLEYAGEATLAAIQTRGDTVRGPAELSPAAVTTQCLGTWRMTQGIYRIDPTLYAALVDTPITGDIPAEVLTYLPEWCVYVETPGMTVPSTTDDVPVLGLWYWLDANPRCGLTLCIGIDIGRQPPLIVQHVPLIGTIEQAIDETMREWTDAYARGNAKRLPPPDYAAAARAWLPPVLSLVLYLCSRASDISGRGQPGNPTAHHARRQGDRLYAASGPRRWDVGVRLGAALRAAYAGTGGDAGDERPRSAMRPHIRRAHWHTYLSGPRGHERNRELKWMPPLAVAIEDYDALPTTVRRLT